MSWHRSYSTRAQFDADSPLFESGTPTPLQLAEARAAAEGLILSGAAGDGEVLVNLSGHVKDGPNSGATYVAVTVTATT
jgi:hypothetical protein